MHSLMGLISSLQACGEHSGSHAEGSADSAYSVLVLEGGLEQGRARIASVLPFFEEALGL